MTINEMFAASGIQPDDETGRTCGTCAVHKPYTDFYKDGTDKDGNPKYRRDCKECYRKSRLNERHLKKAAESKAAKRNTKK